MNAPAPISHRFPLGKRLATAAAIGCAALSCVDPIGPSVGRVEVSPRTLQLRTSETQAVTARVVDSDGATLSGRRVHWSTQNATVATVTAAGVITAVAVGTTQIAASSEGQSALVQVTVSDPPVTQVRITPATPTVLEGASVILTAQALHAGGGVVSGRPVVWGSSAQSIATVNATGFVSAVAAGTATISATIDGIVGSALITVQRAPVASVAVAPATAAVLVGQTVQLTASVSDVAGGLLTGRTVVWSSSAPSIISVSSTGAVTGLAQGAATITATSEGKSATSRITSTLVPVSAVTVAPSAATLSLGTSAQLVALPVSATGVLLSGRRATWVSDRPTIVSVTGDGVVVALATGTARITATVDGKSGSAVITSTTIPVSRVVVAPTAATMPAGSTTRLTATPYDAAGTVLAGRVVTWVSGAPTIATVDQTGLVTAVGPGTALVFATCEGQRATFTATVTAVPVAAVGVTPASSNLNVGGSVQLSASITDKSGAVVAGKVAAWSSNAPSVATVSPSGLVSAVAPGSATITASSDGVTGSALITVSLVPVATVTLSPSTSTLTAGQTSQYSATLRDANNNVLTGRAVAWSSSATNVATVTSSGLVTAVSVGTAQIRAVSGGVTGTAALTVQAVPITSIVVTPDPAVVVVGTTAQLSAVVRNAQGTVATGQAVSWSVADRAVATVNAAGVIGGLREGGTIITVTAAAQGQASPARTTVVLTVVAPPSSRPSAPSLSSARKAALVRGSPPT